MSKTFNVLTTTPFAHRGLHNEVFDENSTPSFELALEKGFGIELDVHVTKDGVPVVMHDANLARTTGVDKRIPDSLYSEIEDVVLLKSKTKIPLLRDVLKLVDGRVPLMVELKAENSIPSNLVDAVLDVVNDYPHKDKLALQAFNPYVVKALKSKQTMYPVGQLMSDDLPNQKKYVLFMYRSLLLLHLSKPDFINYEVKYLKKRNLQRKRRKYPLLTWTIDDYEKYQTAKELADNYIFEHIDI